MHVRQKNLHFRGFVGRQTDQYPCRFCYSLLKVRLASVHTNKNIQFYYENCVNSLSLVLFHLLFLAKNSFNLLTTTRNGIVNGFFVGTWNNSNSLGKGILFFFIKTSNFKSSNQLFNYITFEQILLMLMLSLKINK